MSRNLTDSEKQFALSNWPHLNVDTALVTGDATLTYNCLAWTLGITSRWVWPWRSGTDVTKAQFDQLYADNGYDPSDAGAIAVFGVTADNMQHGSLYSQTYSSPESKCGSWLRITHTLRGMEGGSYGDVEGFYTPASSAQRKIEFMQQSFERRNRLSAEEVRVLETAIQKTDPALRTAFDNAYRKWKATWEHPLVMSSSNPFQRTKSIEFLELVALGSGILPLLIDQLRHEEEFFALQATDRLLNPALVVTRDPRDELALLGEQGRALETVKRWIQYNS